MRIRVLFLKYTLIEFNFFIVAVEFSLRPNLHLFHV